ncbi:hypothetical protein SAMN05216588_12627 [Pseudomonas flavescens]|uniref:Uncharacterized protein n=1 Tax=Phytopseudomonas flavescens TaxID=29435 RepID=A0A1G8NX33_9GAMM|nr:hypothetical protein [Pseudomonas flavescens]SDI84080.1 hypothetical protein SAMN05216588_12627 [Pseudomonas flavescens]
MSKKRTPQVRQQDAQRQQNKRDRDAEHRERMGAEVIKVTTYRGTRSDLETMQQVGGFEERDEAITLAVRYMASMARRNPAAYLDAMNPRSPV